MDRIRIRIHEVGDDSGLKVFFNLEEPRDVPNPMRLIRLDCDVSAAPFAELAGQVSADPMKKLVRDVGTAVYQRLVAHDGVKAALERAGNSGAANGTRIVIEMRTEAAEALPFEALFANKFWALDDRFPIVRVPLWNGEVERTIERLCPLPLRATLVISAADRQNYEDLEWKALHDAFAESGVDYRLQVFVGRPDLFEQIEASDDPNVEVRLIDTDMRTGDLMRAIGGFEPTILHFFCHGIVESAPYLEVATKATHEASEEPLYIPSDEVRRINQSLCLLTLNACSGAAPVQGAYAMALAIANDGVPAVVGMRETIEAKDANTFSAAFYAAVLRGFAQLFAHPDGEAPDWARLMHEPRLELSTGSGPPHEYAQIDKRWTLPVLYVRPETLRIHLVDTARRDLGADTVKETFGELTMLKEARGQLHQNTPDAMIEEIDARIQQLEAGLESYRPGAQVMETSMAAT